MTTTRIALAQIDTTVGDLAGNAERVLESAEDARALGAAIVVFPELTLTGYPPRDLLDRHSFVPDNLRALETLAAEVRGIAALVGFVDRNPGHGRPWFNSVAVIEQGKVASVHRKTLLPNYDVFDEERHFEPAPERRLARVAGISLGISICEDLWTESSVMPRPDFYRTDPVAELRALGAEAIVNVSASPWQIGRERTRTEIMCRAAARYGVPLVLCNLVGGNDELIFDGSSLVASGKGELLARAASFREDLLVVDLAAPPPPIQIPEAIADAAAVHDALLLGLGDYARKCGFAQAVVGLSGGIDSSLVAALAAASFGPGQVWGVAMPSPFNARESLEDAAALAQNLGIRFSVIPITPMMEAFRAGLSEVFAGSEPGTAEENVQARIRGTLLMAISNKFGSLVLSTGNKSELSVGYCTLYGDMAGGLAVISDVPKTLVYAVAREVNRRAGRDLIPARVFEKAPSAELRPDQKDTDSLPDYAVLDRVLRAVVEENRAAGDAIASGLADADTIARVVRMIYGNEYKRSQAAPGLRVTSKAFGTGRRMPIAQRYRG